MHLITISATFPILRKSNSHKLPKQIVANFDVSSQDQMVKVKIFENEDYANAEIQQIEISEELYVWLKSGPLPGSSYPVDVAKEINAIISALDTAARTVVESIKYLLLRPQMLDNVLGMIANFVWFEEGMAEFPIPIPSVGYVRRHSSLPLSDGISKELQVGFDSGYKPLVGMRHLFRAMQEEEPRFRWIDATIALELAIKEALIRKCPEFETLLLEMPSPPLDKLYGGIMKEYLGITSPYVKQIKEGVSIRNKLLHRPDGTIVSKEKASEYLKFVALAINHLFAQLYPDWIIAKNMEKMVFQG